MNIVLILLFGLAVGFIVRAFLPDARKMGLFATTALGVVGSFLGAFLMSLLTERPATEINPANVFGSVAVALLLVLAAGRLSNRNAVA